MGDPQGESPIDRAEHPRLVLTSSELADIRTLAGTDSTFLSQLQSLVTYINGQMAIRTDAYMASSNEVLTYLLNMAAAYYLAGGSVWNGTALVSGTAVSGVTGLLTPAEYSTRVKAVWALRIATADQSSGDGGKAAIAYDWSYPMFNSTERAAVVAWLTARLDHVGGSAFDFWNDVGDALRMEEVMLRAMAIKNDGDADSYVTTYDKFATWWRGSDGWASGHGAYGGTGSGWTQGMLYGNGYHAAAYGLTGIVGGGSRIMDEAARTALGISRATYYSHDDARTWRYYPRYVLRNLTGGVFPTTTVSSTYAMPRTNGYQYLWRPGELARWHATIAADMPGKTVSAPAAVATLETLRFSRAVAVAMGDTDMASLAQWLIATICGSWSPSWTTGEVLTFFAGRGGESVATPASPTEAGEGLSMFAPEGHWTFRTDWTTRGAPCVMVLSQKWVPGAYGFRHVGEILAFKNGPALNRLTGWSGHAHTLGGAISSSMTFPTMSATRTQLTGSVSGDAMASTTSTHVYLGGERIDQNYQIQASDMVDGGAYDCLRETRQWLHDGSAARDVDYLFLDLYKSYYEYTTKLNGYVRQIVYFRPSNVAGNARLVVFDRPSVKSPYDWNTGTGAYAKMQGWVTAGEPTFEDGTVSAGPSRGPSGTAGKSHTLDGTYVSATNTEAGSDNTVHLSVVRPTSNRRLLKVGGPNGSGQYTYYTAGDAANWSHITDMPQGYTLISAGFDAGVITPNMAGQWHVYVEDLTTDAQTIFVTAVEITDAGDPRSTVEAVTGSGFTGARVGDRIAVFGETNDALTSGTFVIPTAGTYKVLISGLAASAARTVTGSGATVTGTMTSSSAGTLYLTITTTGSNTTMTVG